jgi:hypothetical protein
MTFISWSYLGRYKNDRQVYQGFESGMTNHKKPKDCEDLELLIEVVKERTITLHGFETVSCTILSIC